MYWSAELVADVPPVVVTVMSTFVPEVFAGAETVQLVAPLQVPADSVPNFTVPPLRLEPVIVTEVPVGPVAGEIPLTTGGAT